MSSVIRVNSPLRFMEPFQSNHFTEMSFFSIKTG